MNGTREDVNEVESEALKVHQQVLVGFFKVCVLAFWMGIWYCVVLICFVWCLFDLEWTGLCWIVLSKMVHCFVGTVNHCLIVTPKNAGIALVVIDLALQGMPAIAPW